MTSPGGRGRALGAAVVLVVAVACQGAQPSAPSVLLAGEAVANDCDRAVVARAELERDQGSAAAAELEHGIYRACTFDQFAVANDKLLVPYRYEGDLHTHVGRRCLRLISPYHGTRLCESLEP
ncbi:MAG TPA: hypothetical protein VHK63_09960 [Candidatus Limnocylindria bacterium]|nr:hypothetical protein [Candidatus Limnocylindria bacterium]